MNGEQLTIQSVAGSHTSRRIVKLTGPLTLSTLVEFQDAIRAEQADALILDVSQVSYMDSAGLGSLVNAHVSCVKGGRRLALVGVTGRVQSLLKTTRVYQVFVTFPSLAEAEAGLAEDARA